MRLRFPIYAKVLLWFFLNLVLLAAGLLLLLHARFNFGFDWLLAAGAGQRIQSVCDVVMGDLAEKPPSEWNQVLQRFDQIMQVKFLLFDNGDGRPLAGEPAQLAGEPTQLPPAVREFVQGPRRGPRPPRGDFRGRPPPGLPPEGPPPEVRPPGETPKHVVRTTGPTRYWVLMRVRVPEAGRRPVPATLIAVSPNLSAGGLLFDFRPWLALALGAMLFSVLLWFPLVRSLTRSIGQITQATRRIAEGRFDGRVDERRRDELGSLGQSINRMAVRLSGLVNGQRRFLGDIAHELCAPIARIQVALGILEQRADAKSQAYVQDLHEEVQHMSKLVNELLSFSKASLGAPAKLRPVRVLELAEEAVRREVRDGVQIDLEVPAQLFAVAEPELLLRALANLLRNAIRYGAQAGPINLSAGRDDRGVWLSVADCGPGVPERELERIFDPFYRLDPSRDAATGGVGLGLAIVKTCAESCGGSVSCRNRQPNGLEAIVRLSPAAEPPAPEPPAGEASMNRPGTTPPPGR